MKKGCFIIETRPLDFKKIIGDHLRFIPDDWALTVFGSNENEKIIERDFPSAKFIRLPQNLTNNFNARTYNKLLTNRGFWVNVPYDNFLVFQHDSQLLRCCLDDFIEYDFIGAPLYHIPFPMMNGGLSIRSKKAMIDSIDLMPYSESRDGNEDIYFCKLIKSMAGKLPTKEVAMQFSVETIFYPKPIGVHAPEKYLRKEQLKLLGI